MSAISSCPTVITQKINFGYFGKKNQSRFFPNGFLKVLQQQNTPDRNSVPSQNSGRKRKRIDRKKKSRTASSRSNCVLLVTTLYDILYLHLPNFFLFAAVRVSEKSLSFLRLVLFCSSSHKDRGSARTLTIRSGLGTNAEPRQAVRKFGP